MDLVVVAVTFGTIFVVELPDKTFIATLVLSTRLRPVLVWVGVSLAFAVQTVVAIALGSAVSLLPSWVATSVALAMFSAGFVLLTFQARRGEPEDSPDAPEPVTGWRVVATSFLVLFAAEWGDLSQLLTITMVARYEAPLSVFCGALAALMTVSALAVIAGRTLMRFITPRALYGVGAVACLVLACLTAYELFT